MWQRAAQSDLRVYDRSCLSLCANDSRKQCDKYAPDCGQHYPCSVVGGEVGEELWGSSRLLCLPDSFALFLL